MVGETISRGENWGGGDLDTRFWNNFSDILQLFCWYGIQCMHVLVCVFVGVVCVCDSRSTSQSLMEFYYGVGSLAWLLF